MNYPTNTTYGLTASQARFEKAGADANQHLSAWERYMEKQAISNQIADPIDRKAELCGDWVDFCRECARNSARQLIGSSCFAPIADFSIAFRAEMQKYEISQAAEMARYYRDVRQFNVLW